MNIQMDYKKLTVFFVLVLLVGSMPIEIVEAVEPIEYKTFGEECLEYLEESGPSIFEGVFLGGLQIHSDEDVVDFYFYSEYPLVLEGPFSNILWAHESDFPSFIKLNKTSGLILEADFTITESREYLFGNNLFFAPSDSRIIFDGDKIDLKVSEGAKFESLPSLLDSNLFGNDFEIEGKNIEVRDDLFIREGRIILKDNGYLIEEGEVEYKDLLFHVGEDNEKILISDEKLKDYSGNWIFSREDNLELHSFEEGQINMQFLEGNSFVGVSDAFNSVGVQVKGGDFLEVRNEIDVPKFVHHYSENGETRISNGNLGTFVYTKDDLQIVKEFFNSTEWADVSAMNLFSTSPSVDLGLEINGKGEISMLKDGEIIGSFNQDLFSRLEGFSLGKLKKNHGEDWEYVLERSIFLYMEELDLEYKESEEFVNLISQKQIHPRSVFFRSSVISAYDLLREQRMSEEDSMNLISKMVEEFEEDSYFALGYALPATLEAGLTPDQSVDLISKVSEISGGSRGMGLIGALPATLEAGLTPDQSVDLISKVIEESEINLAFALDTALPATLEAGLTPDQSVDLISKVIKGYGTEFKSGLSYALPSILKFYDGSNSNEIAKGIDVASDFIWLSSIAGSELDYSKVKDKVSFGKEFSNAFERNLDDFEANQLDYFAVTMNQLHDLEGGLSGTDSIRQTIARELDFESKYRLIAESNGDLYTSSFLSLYDNFPENVVEEIREVDPEGEHTLDFVLQMSNRNKLNPFLEEDADFFVETIEEAISGEKGDLVENSAFLTNTFVEFYEDEKYLQEKEYFENVLLEKYQNAKNFEEKGTYAFLLKLNEDPTNSMVKSLNEELPELPSFEIPSSWLGDDTLSMKSYFYDDESWYEQTIDLLRN